MKQSTRNALIGIGVLAGLSGGYWWWMRSRAAMSSNGNGNGDDPFYKPASPGSPPQAHPAFRPSWTGDRRVLETGGLVTPNVPNGRSTAGGRTLVADLNQRADAHKTGGRSYASDRPIPSDQSSAFYQQLNKEQDEYLQNMPAFLQQAQGSGRGMRG